MRINVTPRAALDVAEIAIYYDDLEPGLGDRFIAAVEQAYERIAERPTSFPVYSGHYRRAHARPFRVGVFFAQPGEDRIDVIAVLDLRRDPGAIHGRLPS